MIDLEAIAALRGLFSNDSKRCIADAWDDAGWARCGSDVDPDSRMFMCKSHTDRFYEREPHGEK